MTSPTSSRHAGAANHRRLIVALHSNSNGAGSCLPTPAEIGPLLHPSAPARPPRTVLTRAPDNGNGAFGRHIATSIRRRRSPLRRTHHASRYRRSGRARSRSQSSRQRAGSPVLNFPALWSTHRTVEGTPLAQCDQCTFRPDANARRLRGRKRSAETLLATAMSESELSKAPTTDYRSQRNSKPAQGRLMTLAMPPPADGLRRF
jgi:hypothetical protein